MNHADRQRLSQLLANIFDNDGDAISDLSAIDLSEARAIVDAPDSITVTLDNRVPGFTPIRSQADGSLMYYEYPDPEPSPECGPGFVP